MALDKSDSSDSKVTNIAQARQQRLDKSSMPYGRRQTDEADGPNLQARLEQVKSGPNVRTVQVSRPAGRRFNKDKVEKIKDQLARGEYEIDSLKVADLFIEHERHS